MARARKHGYRFAFKAVRGAYMVQEEKRAAERGYPNPIHDDIMATHENYDRVVREALENHDMTSLMIASHNVDSIRKAAEEMARLGIDSKEGEVFFGQLLGMCDQVTLGLGRRGYRVYKYLPYGPIDEVVPYLIRRAEENSDVMGSVSRDKAVLYAELRRRCGMSW